MRMIVSTLLFWYFGGVFPVWAEPDEISNKECRSCHRFSLNEKYSKKGPDLFYAGNKYFQIWLENFLQSPAIIRELAYSSQSGFLEKKTKVNRPHIFLTKGESKRVSNFLMTLRIPDLEVEKVDNKPLSSSEQARIKISFERNYGCISCHRALNLVGRVRGGVSGPSLVNSGLRLNPDWIFNWLKNPKKFLSEGGMPLYDLNEETAVLITKYIVSIRTKNK
ncbi:MAG: hypothetical protein HOD90_03095 [Nitrospina sp.]|nr:hypothetical protein [Nitrospina sp.]